ncbi:MAG: sugar ABC transporter ATP-binding protein, partial [Lachnospiraceae bacterium]|nr:sugar ABC transporter ATP-binding protein [Lachnospiraceae bacterium]
FKMIDLLKKENKAIIYISHRMEEVFELADRVSVLRDGKFIGCVRVGETSREALVNMMVGRELEGGYPPNTAEKGEVVLELKDFNSKGVFEYIKLKVHAGEILGMAGLVGAGRSEIMRALVGYDPLDSGEIILEGEKITIHHPKDAVRHHIIMASEDRKALGLVLDRNIRENIALQNFAELSNAGFINKPLEKKECREYADQMTVKMNGIEDIVGGLSGGNQQKVVLAKCMLSHPKVLILDEPTRGIDVGAKAMIYNLMLDMAKQGIAIIMISSEMPELIGMSDRIIVMSGGKITGEVEGDEAKDQEKILKLALGGL